VLVLLLLLLLFLLRARVRLLLVLLLLWQLQSLQKQHSNLKVQMNSFNSLDYCFFFLRSTIILFHFVCISSRRWSSASAMQKSGRTELSATSVGAS